MAAINQTNQTNTQLKTDRLILRHFTADDAPRVYDLLKDNIISKYINFLPSPYELQHATDWIATHEKMRENQTGINFAIIIKDTNQPIGVVSLGMMSMHHRHAELGYWIGQPYWSNGYVTEAAKAILDYGFNVCNLNRIYSYHVPENTASGRIMEKLNMAHEGTLRQHLNHNGKLTDSIVRAILKQDFLSSQFP
ncbi:Putative ribosomal N-acetyltransferase YdaF [Poriferisphaera corsica]|uniref:Ribosomal N-acetyltransferase YdaF n=1 Tax=Poriferisphaera corsica TaxID=2528020 RepID=A0A517YPR4_9BACT|nr:GNAT family N-acetyltransferase [Poriferisphaera corsica]QDU32224.1 Putative ribosomal N-acetyltransferase YdaF [Poriferisphaera corsica]